MMAYCCLGVPWFSCLPACCLLLIFGCFGNCLHLLAAAAHRPEFPAGSQAAVMDAAAWVSRKFQKAAHCDRQFWAFVCLLLAFLGLCCPLSFRMVHCAGYSWRKVRRTAASRLERFHFAYAVHRGDACSNWALVPLSDSEASLGCLLMAFWCILVHLGSLWASRWGVVGDEMRALTDAMASAKATRRRQFRRSRCRAVDNAAKRRHNRRSETIMVITILLRVGRSQCEGGVRSRNLRPWSRSSHGVGGFRLDDVLDVYALGKAWLIPCDVGHDDALVEAMQHVHLATGGRHFVRVSVLAIYEALAVSDGVAHLNAVSNFGLVGHVGSLECCFASV